MSIERIEEFRITPDPRWPPSRASITLTTEVSSTLPGGELGKYRYRITDQNSPITFAGGELAIYRGPEHVSYGGSRIQHRAVLEWRPGAPRNNLILRITVFIRGEDGRRRIKTSSVRIQQ